MKRLAGLMAFGLIFPRLLAAQAIDVDALVGESWYGLYLNGEKAGYAMMSTEKTPEGQIVVLQDARFHIAMAGVRQEIEIYAKRIYAASGDLLAIESHFVDPSGQKNSFDARVNGDKMVLKNTVNGQEETLPKPRETLADALKHERWVIEGPKEGDTLEFSLFEPMFQRELTGISRIAGTDTRILDGVSTKVYKIETELPEMGLDSVSYVAEDGTTLEDVAAGMFTMRLEPKEVAQTVDYSNDVIVSNAAMVNRRITDARERDTLELVLRGPLTMDHLFNDERQTVTQADDHVVFKSKRMDLSSFTAAKLPIENADLAQWLVPTPYVQSNDPRLVAKSREIVGDEKDTLAVSNKLCTWVYENMRSTYSARLTNAAEVLESLQGDCTEHSILFVGLARAAGLPAREVAGVVYVDGVRPGFYFHQWAKVWVGKWIDVDPTFNQPLADVTHIKLAEGDLFAQSKIIPLIGHLQIEDLDEAAASPEPEKGQPAPETPEKADTTPPTQG